ncbi:hypothetical protein G3N59_27290 [Paraburkholderia sp. Ac-20340]|uniref:hypothetical protein n=1 Tax=Paraburkholderia sp. Ac-20340 TaxID=2703888 RepID=UPI00197E7E8A|nr:hypothetical protein [Paraburkholderia sp. Ac-20340]MBN3857092.1 hypothetical protein [Paraburkholderia sp. Ac-20340]
MIVFKSKKSSARRSFDEELIRLKNHKDQLSLPRPTLAMWQGDAKFRTDVSNSSIYNERFIETEFMFESGISYGYLVSAWHTVSFLATTAVCIKTHEISFLTTFCELFTAALLICFLWMLSLPSGRIRYNRQAQLVHLYYGKKLIALQWRNAHPFAKIVRLGSIALDIYFPTGSYANKVKSEIIPVTGNFDVSDAGLDSSFYRWEFIRRYMEDGLEAIAPASNPEPGFEPRKASGQFRKTFDIFYYLGFGFLIDRWAAYWNARFRWPEEVERLCHPGADLTGYDTSPVASSKTHFYRFDPRQGGYYICDAQGNELRDATRAERAATYPSSAMK